MIRRRSRNVILLGAVLAALMASLLLAPARAASGAYDRDSVATTRTPVKHFLFLMQENHSFDNYFGTFPGADGIPKGTCVPVSPGTRGRCVEPFSLSGRAITDLGHTGAVFRAQLRGGKNDGFISAFTALGDPTDQALGYYTGEDLPYYWNIAKEYVLFDRFFTSAGAGSVWNHMYWITGTPGNPKYDSIPPEGFGDLPTIFDRLEAAGVSWKFYVQNYDPSITYRTFRTQDNANRGAQVIWAPLLAYGRYLDNPRLFAKIAPLEEYFQDLQNGTLPSVSFMVPSGASEHPPGSVKAGETFVRSLHTALLRSSAWRSSAFLWSYDDWGGWYDHVVPPQIDAYGYGYRVPTLMIGAQVRRGHIDSTTLDFTSARKFIQYNWGVAPLAARDKAANNLLSAFDFSAAPRAPELTADTLDVPPAPVSHSSVIYRSYGAGILGAIGISLLLIVGMWVHRRVTLRRARPVVVPGHARPPSKEPT